MKRGRITPNAGGGNDSFAPEGTLTVVTESANTLPKTLPGAVCTEWKKCGKPSCRCAHGKLHGPYYYRYWREGGRLRKAYVPRSIVGEVRARCEATRLQRMTIAHGWADFRQILQSLREARPQ